MRAVDRCVAGRPAEAAPALASDPRVIHLHQDALFLFVLPLLLVDGFCGNKKRLPKTPGTARVQ